MKIQNLADFIEAYTPSDEKKVISFVSLRSARKWDNGQFKVFYTLTMRDDLYTNTILTFEEECLLDTIFSFQQWLYEEISDEQMYSALDEANEKLERDFHNHN